MISRNSLMKSFTRVTCFLTAYLDALQQFLGLPLRVDLTQSDRKEIRLDSNDGSALLLKKDAAQSAAIRMRREFHGDESAPVFDRKMSFSWVEPYLKARARVDPSVCDRVVQQFEARVNVYGYSLVDLMAVTHSEVVRRHQISIQE